VLRIRAAAAAAITSLSVIAIGWAIGAESALPPRIITADPASVSGAAAASPASSVSTVARGPAVSLSTAPLAPAAPVKASTPAPAESAVPAAPAAPVRKQAPAAPVKAPAPVARPKAPAPAPPPPVVRPSGTFIGSIVPTQYGNVQVQVILRRGVIADVVALQLTSRGGQSVSISNYAAPVLRSEVLSAQSARVGGVSGATYTSYGYLTSLQAALDRAKF
jgi:uncharacterized protein with FMN-binding domain